MGGGDKKATRMWQGDKKINRNTEYGKRGYQVPTDKNLEKKAKSYFKQRFNQFEVEPDESQSQKQEREETDPIVFCSVCGAPQSPPLENHQPSIASIEETFKSRDLVISTNLQDDKSLFVALLEESTPDANELEQNILSHKLVSDVAMVDGGLIIQTFMKSIECDECGESSVIEWESSKEHEPTQPYHQTIQNKVELLKQMADDEVVDRFQSIVEGGEIDKDTVKHREMLKGQRDKFSSSDGEDSLSFGSINTGPYEWSTDGSLESTVSSLEKDGLQEKLEEEGYDVLTTDDDS